MRIVDFNFQETRSNYIDRFEASEQLLEAAFQAANHICGNDESKSLKDRVILTRKILQDALAIGEHRIEKLSLDKD